MKFNFLKNFPIAVAVCCVAFLSCRKEASPDPVLNIISTDASLQHPVHPQWKKYMEELKTRKEKFIKTDQFYKTFFSDPRHATAPSECEVSVLNEVVENYFNDFEFWDFVLFPDYVWINQLSAISDRSQQYFGANGEYTKLVTKQQRRLEPFWKLQNAIHVNGQHSETLGNRDKIAEVFIMFNNATPHDGYYVADQIIEMNKESKVFPHSPLLSFDAFATTTNLIVIGDGLIQALTSTGITDDIVVGGLLSHEWAHQVQFHYAKSWYGVTSDEIRFTPEKNRQIELEADFLSAYFLTHKHGGVYNWKRVAEFLQLFYNIGDCDFTSSDHHGTPDQRLSSARFGYTIANQTLPKGKILNTDQLHNIFMNQLATIIGK